MKKVLLLLFVTSFYIQSIAQPTVLGTQTVNGDYAKYDLTTRGLVRYIRLQAATSASSGSRNWEFATGTASNTNYSTNWRPYNSGLTLLGFNTVIDPSTEASARYNSNFGGASGLMPSIMANNYYTFIVGGNSTSDNLMSVIETTYNPKAITTVSRNPSSVTAGQNITINITVSGPLSTGERVFIRWHNGAGYASATITEVTNFGSGTSGSVTIPAQGDGTTVSYYVLSSNEPTLSNANVDYFTLEANNNNGSNYSFTVGPGVYSWNQAGSASWTTASNWTPERTSPAASDILHFNNGGATIVTDVPTQSIGGLFVSNNSTVSLQAGGGNTLTINNGVSGADFSVSSGSRLNVNGTNNLQVSIASGATGSVLGTIEYTSGSTLLPANANSLIFGGGSSFIQNINSGNVFGSSGISNAVIFTSRSTFIQNSGNNPFGSSGGRVVFQTGSLYKYQGGSGLAFSGRTFGNFEFSATTTPNPTGTAAFTIDTLMVTQGIFNINVTAEPGHSIKGNIVVNSGATLTFTPTTAGAVNLNGSVVQQIINNGTINIGSNSTINVASGSIVDFGTSTITGPGTLAISSGGTVRTANANGIRGTSAGSIQTTTFTPDANANFVFNGTNPQITGTGFPSTVANLTIANTGTAPNNTVTLSDSIAANSLTLTSGTLNLSTYRLGINNNGTITGNGGDFATTSTSGILRFTGNATIGGTDSLNFFPAIIQHSGGVNYGTRSKIRTSLKLNAGSSVSTNAPLYSTGSTLIYNTGGTYNIGSEWNGGTSGRGVPHHVKLGDDVTGSGLVFKTFGGTDLTAFRQCNGDFTITDGSSLTLSAAVGGDLRLGGNWVNQNTVTGTGFNHNNRALWFIGTGLQTLENASGTLTVGYLLNEKPSGTLQLKSNLVLNGTTTNTANTAQVLQLLDAGALDINGKTLTINPGQPRSIGVNGAGRQISSAVAGGILHFPEGPGMAFIEATNSGTLAIGNNVTLQLRRGINFGANRTTIAGTLELFPNSFCDVNSPVYGPAGKLKYSTGLYSTGNEWVAGTTVGVGVPSAVELALSPTSDSLTVTGTRTVTGPLTLTSGKLFLNGQTLTVNGAVSGLGSFTGSPSSSLTLGGTGSQLNFTQSSADTRSLRNLTLNSGAEASLQNALDITAGSLPGAVEVQGGANLMAQGHLTLKSDANGTAYVAPSAGTITGDVTVERFVPVTAGTRRYRLLTAPVKETSIHAAWQEGRTFNGTSFSPSAPQPGFGTMITGQAQGTAATANGNGFDFWEAIANNVASLRYYQGAPSSSSAQWRAPANTTFPNAFNRQQAYLLFIRGDRSVYLSGGPAAATMRATGELKQGDTVSATLYGKDQQSHTLLGNPYAAPLEFKSLVADNSSAIENYFWVWNAALGSSTGAYAVVMPDANNPANYEIIPNPVPGSSPANSIIPSGSGFFVVPRPGQTGTSTLIFKEAYKAVQQPGLQLFRVHRALAPTTAKLYVKLNTVTTAGEKTLLDGVLAQYNETFADSPKDIGKAANGSENLSVLKGNSNLIVASHTGPKNGDVLQLRLWNTLVQDYRFEIQGQSFPASGVSAVLEDAFTGTQTPVSLTGESTEFIFSITGEAASKDPLRFRIIFKEAITLPLQVTTLRAQEKAGGVVVSWTVNHETRIRGYEVEKSTDGRQFRVIALVNATGASGPQVYEAADPSPSPVGYYRIKLLERTGEVKRSSVVQIKLRGAGSVVQVFPNPITGGSMNVQLQNQPSGVYHLTLFNAAGQRVVQKQVQHAGGSQNISLMLPLKPAKGVYRLQVRNSGGKKEVLNLVAE